MHRRALGGGSGVRGSYAFRHGKTPDPVSDGYAHTASYFGDVPLLQELLGKDKGFFCKLGPHQWTPLMVAALAGKHEAVAFLVGQGFDVEERDNYLRTALHYACKHGHTHVVRQLIQKGCDVDRMDEHQKTCLIYAADSNNLAMIGCLLSGGADPDTSDQKLWTPLHYLTQWREEGTEASLQLCLSGSDANLQDLQGWTPLHLAASMGQASLCRVLLSIGGADPSIKDDDGLTPSRMAKTTAVQAMLMAAPWQSYTLRRLRCIAIMRISDEEDCCVASPTENLRRTKHAIVHHRDLLWAMGDDSSECGPSSLWS